MSRRDEYFCIEERLMTVSIPMMATARMISMNENPSSVLICFTQHPPRNPSPPAAPITLQNTGATLTTLNCHCTSTQYPAIAARQAAASAHCEPEAPKPAFPARAADINTHQNAETPSTPIDIAMSSVSLWALSILGGPN